MSAPKDTSMASPFASKLGTNYCPLDDEVLQIRALLKAPLSRLKQLDDQIAELQKAIDELAEERESVRSFVDRHKDLISPFRRLPLDVIQEIFVACLPTHRNCVMTAVEAPVLLGRICSAWRSISLGTPRLWARLHIVEPSRSGTGSWFPSRAAWEGKIAQRLDTTKTWLGRSGQCPLSISFQGSHDPPLPDVVDPLMNTRLFMDILLSFGSRWEDISLGASTPALEMLSSITEHDVPLLQKFEMSLDGEFSNGRLNFALLGAQHLKQLSVSGSAVRNIRGLPVRWEDLTHLSVTGYNNISLSSSDVLELLAECSQLRECQIDLNQADNSLSQTDGYAHNSIQLPFLHYFHVSCFGLAGDGIRHVFRRLSLPKLRNLELRSYFSSDLGPGNFPLAEVLITSLAVSSCFEGLTIDTQQFTSPSLAKLFRGLPQTTTSLRIADRPQAWNSEDVHCVLDDAAIAVLIPTPENSGGCPALQELSITHCTALSDAVLLQFLKARMTVPTSPLKKVKIKFARERQLDILPDIQPFLDDGRGEVSLVYHTHSTTGAFSPWQGLPDAPENVWAQDEFR